MEEGKRKYLITVIAIVLILLTVSLGTAKEAEAKDSIYVDIGLGMNYSVVNQKFFLEPKLVLEFFFTEKIMADISFGFETHSTDYSGIQKLEQKYFAIDLLGKYFVLEEIWAGVGFGYVLFMDSSTINAATSTAGEIHPDMIRMLLSVGYLLLTPGIWLQKSRIYLDPSVLIRLGFPTEEADSFDLTVGLYFTIAFGIVRK